MCVATLSGRAVQVYGDTRRVIASVAGRSRIEITVALAFYNRVINYHR